MKSKKLQKIIGVALSTVVAFSMSAMPVYSETKTKVLSEIQEEKAEDVLSVALPFDMSFSIFIADEKEAGLVSSENFNIINYGDDDVVVVVDSIHYIFNDAENCEASDVPITPEIMQKSDKKLLYMQMLSDEKASIQELVLTDKPSEEKNVFNLGTGGNNTASFRFFGSANSNTAVNWKDKDVKVIANFSIYKKDAYEKMLAEEELTEVLTSLVEESSQVSESTSEVTSEETTEVTTEQTTEITTTEVTEITEQTTENTVVEVTENQTIYPLDEVILDDDSSDGGSGGGSDFNTSGGAIEIGTSETTTEVSTDGNQGGGSDVNGDEKVSESSSEETTEETSETTSEETTEETSEITSEESTEESSSEELDSSTEDSSEESSSEDESINADADESGLGKDSNGGNSSMIEADAVADEKVSGDMEEEIEPEPDYPTTSEPPFEEEVEEVEVVEEIIEEIEEPADEEDIEAE